MVPHLIYHKAFKMEDGTDPDLTEGKEYELNCVYSTQSYDNGEYILAFQILDDDSMVHTFFSDEEWFSEHFTVVGDIESVKEEI